LAIAKLHSKRCVAGKSSKSQKEIVAKILPGTKYKSLIHINAAAGNLLAERSLTASVAQSEVLPGKGLIMSTSRNLPEQVAAATFGQAPDGRTANLFTLIDEGIRVRITNFGGRIVSVESPDKSGRRNHVVLGFESVAEYMSAGGSFGALLGRTANRIGGGAFTLDGHTYDLVKNEGDATLHGGRTGFDKLFWSVEEARSTRLVLAHTSPDGDQGFPGELSATAIYRLEGDTLWLSLEASTTKPCPVSLSAHPYFNLGGPPVTDVFGHEIEIPADAFLPSDARQIPTGELRPVQGTVFDFRRAVPIGARIRDADPQLLFGKGYDHYFVLDAAKGNRPRLAARVHEPQSGRTLEVWTTQPGTQFYTGNNLNGSVAGRGGAYRQSAGLAMEPQGFPDAPNRPEFPSTILRPGGTYREVTGYRLTAD
jgi:aldose 1-epimerase